MFIDNLFTAKNFLNLQGRKDFQVIFQQTQNPKVQFR